MSRTRIKICGITRRRDAECAVAAGADALGVILHADSQRAISLEEAASVLEGLPPMVEVVGVFVNAPRAFLERACAELPLDLLQFHGEETAERCGRYGLPWMKALAVKPGENLVPRMAEYAAADALLLDTYREGGGSGGSGHRFDWSLVPADVHLPLVLAGGLTPDNVGEAIRQVAPFAVDVSSGVESGPGIKDPAEIERFVAAVKAADDT